MPLRGQKYTSGLNRVGPKTGRLYAQMVSAVRARDGFFTTADFTPEFSRAQISTLMGQLYRKGEFELIRRGVGGPNSRPAIYRRREQVRRLSTLDTRTHEPKQFRQPVVAEL